MLHRPQNLYLVPRLAFRRSVRSLGIYLVSLTPIRFFLAYIGTDIS